MNKKTESLELAQALIATGVCDIGRQFCRLNRARSKERRKQRERFFRRIKEVVNLGGENESRVNAGGCYLGSNSSGLIKRMQREV